MRHVVGIFVAVLLAVNCMAEECDAVDGVFRFSGFGQGSKVAIWVPTTLGQNLSGVEWYNADGMATFPEILVVAGFKDQPRNIESGISVAQSVSGHDAGWSRVDFESSLTTDLPGMYVAFVLPASSSFGPSADGCPGFGYFNEPGSMRVWVAGPDEDWSPIGSNCSVAIRPIYSSDKSNHNSVVLKWPDMGAPKDVEVANSENSDFSMSVAPNPFNPDTEIGFTMGKTAFVDLSVYDLRGVLVRKLWTGYLDSGVHSFGWNGQSMSNSRVASGVYFVQLKSEGALHTQKIVLVK